MSTAGAEFPNPPESLGQGWVEAAIVSISSPFREIERWDYVMNVRVRLLLFWVGANDVGGGSISKGSLTTDSSSQVIKLLIGSDPMKAPRKINHWGSAMEVHRNGGTESHFFGFMKSSKAASAKDAEAETSSKDAFAFEANISHANGAEALARVVPFSSSRDFTFRDLEAAQDTMIRRVSGRGVSDKDGPFRRLTDSRPGCSRTQGFLQAVERLVEHAVSSRAVPSDQCYVHNARYYTISLRKAEPVKSAQVKIKLRNGKAFERSYENLTQADFEVLNHESKERTRFDLLLGSSGNLRGVPVQIHYQPNWWFQTTLHLDTRNSL